MGEVVTVQKSKLRELLDEVVTIRKEIEKKLADAKPSKAQSDVNAER